MKDMLPICPETCLIFVSFGRPEIAARSYASLSAALAPFRDRIRVVISDATDDMEKIAWARSTDADDVILTPTGVPAATSRNLATTLAFEKYSPKYLCFVEDDFEYSPQWYPQLVTATERLYGVVSPLGLAYGMFTASGHHVSKKLCKEDRANGVTAYFFGAVAYQRFMPVTHYLTVMRGWDPDLLGISYAQTGGQTFRNTMRGFCGAILPEMLSWPIDVSGSDSTWSKGKRHPGPPAHSFEIGDYEPILQAASRMGTYQR